MSQGKPKIIQPWELRGGIAWSQEVPVEQTKFDLIDGGTLGTPIPPMICPICGPLPAGDDSMSTRFHSVGVDLRGTQFMRPCTVCGEEVVVNFPQHISFDRNGIVSYLSGTEFTPEILRRLKALTDEAKTDNATLAQFAAEANNIIPSLGDRLEQFCKDQSAIVAFFSMLAAVIATLLAGISMLKPTEPTPNAPITNNYYNTAPSQNSLSVQKKKELYHLQNSKPVKRRSNLLPPKKKRTRKKR